MPFQDEGIVVDKFPMSFVRINENGAGNICCPISVLSPRVYEVYPLGMNLSLTLFSFRMVMGKSSMVTASRNSREAEVYILRISCPNAIDLKT